MPLGNTPQLQIPLMAENDNQKYLAFNDAVANLDDSFNRLLVVDLSSADATLSESDLTRYVCFRASGHTVTRSITIPTTVGGSPQVVVNRLVVFDNASSSQVNLVHGVNTVSVAANTAVLAYLDGTDILVISGGGTGGGTSSLEVSDEGTILNSNVSSLNFVGTGVSAADNNGDITVNISGGDSAYDIAVSNGFVGTEQEWLDSLEGTNVTVTVFNNQTDFDNATSTGPNDWIILNA